MSGASGDGGIRWNDETQGWEAAGEAVAPLSSAVPPQPVPAHEPSELVWEPYDVSYTVTPPPPPVPRSRRTRALVAAATVAAVAGGIAGGVLGLRDHGGRSGAGSAGSGAASVVSVSGTATSDSGPPTDTDTSGAWSTGSQSPTDVPSGYVLQEDTGFTIAVPEGWNREEKENGVFYNSPDGQSLVQVYTVTEGNLTPYASLSQTSATLASADKKYKKISLQHVSEAAGQDAAELVYAYDRPDGTRRQVVDRAFVAGNGTQYAVLVAGPAADWPRHREILKVALAHFTP